MGLAKKLLLADPLAAMVAPLYAQAAAGAAAVDDGAWIAALGFHVADLFRLLRLYRHGAGSGARSFGIKLPMNFNSPLKATSIIEFWQRWHVSLTRFLTAYIYNPMSLALTRAAHGAGQAGIRRQKHHRFVVLVAAGDADDADHADFRHLAWRRLYLHRVGTDARA